MGRQPIKIIKKVDPRHAGITMLDSPVYPEDEVRNREFASARAEQEYNFVVPQREVRAQDMQQAAATFLRPESDADYSSLSRPAIDRLNAAASRHPAQVYDYGKRNYSSFEAAKEANPDMPIIHNPPSAAKEYEAQRGRAFVDGIGQGGFGLAPIAYSLGGSPETIRASGQFDEALGDLAGANALRAPRVNNPVKNSTTPRAQFKEWPENDGFHYSLPKQLKPGDLVDRYGDDGSPFVAPIGTPFEARGIGSHKKSGPYGAYEILEPMEVPSGPAMPWYGQPGGGTQHKLPAKIEDLIESGKIRRKP